jgi:hypothetical protein
MASSPKAPKPTEQEVQLQNRQREELARLDDEENTRFKRALRGQLGGRRLLSGRAASRGASGGAAASGGSAGGSTSGGRMTIPTRVTGRIAR